MRYGTSGLLNSIMWMRKVLCILYHLMLDKVSEIAVLCIMTLCSFVFSVPFDDGHGK
jgi:hypothetical protein